MLRQYAVHAPALSRQEAVMLPAIEREAPRNLLMPSAGLDFRRADLDNRGGPVGHPVRRGTMAGRALLNYIKSAPAQRRSR